ncbi:MAG: D-alanyl-D-alanine endopeptidase [Pseudomonadota bacterium]|nr:D-alanyl-D-alanine endopeptidase [Pseudomonadota bacterium]
MFKFVCLVLVSAAMLAPQAQAKKRVHAHAAGKQQHARHRASTVRVHYRAEAINADSPTALRSGAVMILDPASGAVLFAKNSATPMPIASLTKLMTAMVVVEAKQDMEEPVTVTDADVDRLKHSSSRLRVGTRLTRTAMLHIALMSSENRAASALGRNYPGGQPAFVAAMNAKAAALGMLHTHYVEPTGLSSSNVSTAEDLAKLVVAAQREPLIRAYSTDHDYTIRQSGRATPYRNTNRLISNSSWNIGLQKTGYINEAGRCMVLHATIKGRAMVMVFLDAQGKFSRAADANRVRTWLASAR